MRMHVRVRLVASLRHQKAIPVAFYTDQSPCEIEDVAWFEPGYRLRRCCFSRYRLSWNVTLGQFLLDSRALGRELGLIPFFRRLTGGSSVCGRR